MSIKLGRSSESSTKDKTIAVYCTLSDKIELDHFIEGLLASVAICRELVRWLQDHEDQAECAKETYGKERSEEESFEFEALQCQGFLF